MRESNVRIINEALEEIESALKDNKNLSNHQSRLIFLISSATISLIEEYLIKKHVFKTGGKIKHSWLKKKKENIKLLIESQIITKIEKIQKIDEILDLAFKIEEKRNQIAYGKTIPEKELKEKINIFLKLKGEIEDD